MATGSRLALVHVARRELALTDEEYRAILMEEAGVGSASLLRPEGVDAVMRRFKAMGFVQIARPKAKRRRDPLGLDPSTPPTDAQQDKLRGLWVALGLTDPTRQQAICKRQTGHPWPQTWAEASKLIDTLRSMAARGWRPKEGDRAEDAQLRRPLGT